MPPSFWLVHDQWPHILDGNKLFFYSIARLRCLYPGWDGCWLVCQNMTPWFRDSEYTIEIVNSWCPCYLFFYPLTFMRKRRGTYWKWNSNKRITVSVLWCLFPGIIINIRFSLWSHEEDLYRFYCFFCKFRITSASEAMFLFFHFFFSVTSFLSN